jgi:hypothetical protein
MDGLDEYLQSDRERIREGPALVDAQNILRAIFNKIRPTLEEADAGEAAGAKLARQFAGSPNSLVRRPIIEMTRAALDGRVKSRYTALPSATTTSEKEKVVESLKPEVRHPSSS